MASKNYLTKEQIADYEKLCHERNNGQLLTPDRHIWPNDDLLVRKVASSG